MLFAGAKTPLQRLHWLKKHTSNRCFLHCKMHTAAALSILCYSLHPVFVSVVSAFCVHFLTFIDNSPIFQIASSRACSLVGRAVAGFVSVVSLRVSGGKVIMLQPINQTILRKSLVKKSFTKKLGGVFVHKKISLYICICTRARASVKNTSKKIFEKSCENVW